ncbi:uncharacterized protein LOC111398988 [Olea europaea subsp. europaea]|uniref:Uncharacterized protein LOC111398988 n=1 Tax=Olea europaea subsp. europaea TaxID=158383 RepID=A0A8S0PEE6_OLEEU|nr:uncharacterized protein LOC111398988 [Olea europaea subsp. europaea]
MAAIGNPSGGHENNFDNYKNREQQNMICTTGNCHPVPNNSLVGPSQVALRYSSGLSVKWSDDEQHILEDLLSKYTSDTIIVRYAKIAQQLNDKTVRDVALRCKWMTKKEYGKRRKEDQNSLRKNKDKKVKATDSLPRSSKVAAHPVLSINNDDGISYKDIAGATGQLLQQNAQALDQISANFAVFKIQENINLFCLTRNNILTMLNEIEVKMLELPKQMPPFPVKLNEELVNSILPQTSMLMPMQMPNQS